MSIDDVRSILGVAGFEKASKAVLVTTSDFSISSRKLESDDSRLELINYKDLQKALNEYLGANWSINIAHHIQCSRERHPLQSRV